MSVEAMVTAHGGDVRPLGPVAADGPRETGTTVTVRPRHCSGL